MTTTPPTHEIHPELVVAAHGSRVPAWRDAVEDLRVQLTEEIGARSDDPARPAFAAVHAGYLEHARPRLDVLLRARLAAGARRLAVLPLFLTESTHAGEDVPGLCGMAPEAVVARLRAEGFRPLGPNAPVTLLPVPDVRPDLARGVMARIARTAPSALASGPGSVAVVLAAYGSSGHLDAWERLVGGVGEALVREHGVRHVTHAWVGHVVGLSALPTRDATLAAAAVDGVRHVCVVPLLMARSRLQGGVVVAGAGSAADALEGGRATEGSLSTSGAPVAVHALDDAILPDRGLVRTLAARALASL